MEKNFCPVVKKGSIFHSDKVQLDFIVVNRTKYFVDVQEVGSKMSPFRVQLAAPETQEPYGEFESSIWGGEPRQRTRTAWDENQPMIILEEVKKAFTDSGKLYTYKKVQFNLK